MTKARPRFRARLFAALGLVYVLSTPHSAFPRVRDVAEVCSSAAKTMLTGGLDEATALKLGLKVDKVKNIEKAFVVPLDKESWPAVKSRVGETFAETKTRFKGRTSKYGKSYLNVTETSAGFQAEGETFLFARTGKQQRAFKVRIRESVEYKNGNVQHYVSVDVTEVTSGKAGKRFAYADYPHTSREGSVWFHAHDAAAEGSPVIANIDAPGFTASVYPAVEDWAQTFINKLP